MAKDKNNNDNKTPTSKESAGADIMNADTRHISIAAQYVKDISFESPGAPGSLRQQEDKPNISVAVDVVAKGLGTDAYEVELKIGATAKRKEETVFICEVEYAGVFILQGIEKEEIQSALLIFCPTLLFPFVRRIVSDLTRDGGFPALMLDPIDFGRLYQARQEADKKAAAQNA